MNQQDEQSYKNSKKKAIHFVIYIVVALVAAYFGVDLTSSPDSATDNQAQQTAQTELQTSASTTKSVAGSQRDLVELARSQRSGQMVELQARVVKILPDDNDGSRHQRFLLAIDYEPSQTDSVLVAHNIDLAPRVPVEEGSIVRIYGQYEWNDRGGVLHWTHHDPAGRHAEGWIELDGVRYD